MKRRKQNLIPLEERRRVIYLERRGGGKKIPAGSIIFGILGILCLLYCAAVGLFMGYGTRFFLIWGVMAVCFGGLSFLLAHENWVRRIPKGIRIGISAVFLTGVIFFAVVEGMILSQVAASAKPGADFVIVLGAQWKQNGPSYVLQKRLNEALSYLEKSPHTMVIVSGGQGPDEPVSEARGMKDYLVQAGIEEERILMEDQSTSTYENLIYSGEFLDKEKDKVVLVTSDFHMFRALHIAERQGIRQIEGQAAPSYPGMLPNNLLREFFGVLKDFAVGNL